MAASTVLFPAPDGPKRIVTPGAKVRSTSRAKPARATFTRMASDSAMADPTSRELVHHVEHRERERRQHAHHGESVALPPRLDRVVDRQRRGLRLAGDIAGHHQR